MLQAWTANSARWIQDVSNTRRLQLIATALASGVFVAVSILSVQTLYKQQQTRQLKSSITHEDDNVR